VYSCRIGVRQPVNAVGTYGPIVLTPNADEYGVTDGMINGRGQSKCCRKVLCCQFDNHKSRTDYNEREPGPLQE
jgi:hypothetical protein